MCHRIYYSRSELHCGYQDTWEHPKAEGNPGVYVQRSVGDLFLSTVCAGAGGSGGAGSRPASHIQRVIGRPEWNKGQSLTE